MDTATASKAERQSWLRQGLINPEDKVNLASSNGSGTYYSRTAGASFESFNSTVSSAHTGVTHRTLKKSIFNFPASQQTWIQLKDKSYANSGQNSHRKVKWFDIFFDLILVGQILRYWEASSVAIANERIRAGLVSLFTGFATVSVIWRHLTFFRNRYHTGRFHDTILIVCIILAQTIGIARLPECVKQTACGATSVEGDPCRICFIGTACSLSLLGAVSLCIASASEMNRAINILEGSSLLLCASPYLASIFLDRPLSEYISLITSIIPLVLPPLVIPFATSIRNQCEPLHIEYFNERCGLFIIVNIAVMVESAISDISGEFGIMHYCAANASDYHEHLAEAHKTADNISPQLDAILYAIVVKMLYFNTYRPSLIAMQRSRTRYQLSHDVSVICIFILSIGLGLNSAAVQMAENNSLASLTLNLSISGTTLIIISVSLLHLNHTVAHGYGVEWTDRKLLQFFGVRLSYICISALISVFLLDGKHRHDAYVFFAIFSIGIPLEKYVLKLPVNFGKERDSVLNCLDSSSNVDYQAFNSGENLA